MTATYNATELAAKPFMQLRLLVGDTDTRKPLKQDEELTYFLATNGGIYRAASAVCLAIAADFSRDADTIQGELKEVLSVRARAYRAMAVDYRNKAVVLGPGTAYAGGISVSDKMQQVQNSDRVPPQFNLGMDDNLDLPVGPVGNETPSEDAPA